MEKKRRRQTNQTPHSLLHRLTVAASTTTLKKGETANQQRNRPLTASKTRKKKNAPAINQPILTHSIAAHIIADPTSVYDSMS
mmetsp:Transcript_10476/g.25354  ORF Transcript_10476/g.25354 Transcript_10476/m.25354 type:complete len:83 (-) Transcript_10476:1130-1378(-)